MSIRLRVSPECADRVPARWSEWASLTGEPVAVSRTTRTVRVPIGGLAVYLKRYRYPVSVAARAVFRNTFFGKSRARREFEMLATFRTRAGPDVVPAPAALGERRCLGLLREAFVATVAVAGSRPLSAALPDDPGRANRLAGFLAHLHRAGLVHGSLFARNLLAVGEEGFRAVDLDRARAGPAGRLPPRTDRARDLAFLGASLPQITLREKLRVLARYTRRVGEKRGMREMLRAAEAWMPEAVRRLARRERVR